MTIGEAVAQEARTWVDTPWHHQGRVKGAGVDCVGLVIGVATACNCLPPRVVDPPAYGEDPTDGQLRMHLNQHLVARLSSSPELGDVLLFAWADEPQHVGIYIGDGWFAHAYRPASKVILSPLQSGFKRALKGAYQWPKAQ